MMDDQPGATCPLCGGGDCCFRLERHGRRYWTCRDCDLLFLDRAQLPASADERRRYSLHDNSQRSSGYLAFLERLRRPVLDWLRQRWPEHVSAAGNRPRGLDYCCGPYPMLAELMAETGFPVVAWDPYFSERPRSSLVAEAPFDFILCCEVAEHFFRPREEFAFLIGLLAPGGLIAVMTARHDAVDRLEAWHYLSDETHVSLFSRRSLDWLAGRLGLRLTLRAGDIAFLELVEAG
ncbi:MAG TPA: 2-polyprenyl-3-methyl-5-hydroxy-6-metoxy-1,4-benzoquinol methylase [Spirochaetaceae bacterium]|nr:2-polyprenyl-3-methyl-5-hydroxy-6-metoxy-1,4-benzoquinol methylase [Spirochaetaceae bacterium]